MGRACQSCMDLAQTSCSFLGRSLLRTHGLEADRAYGTFQHVWLIYPRMNSEVTKLYVPIGTYCIQ